MTDLTVGEFIAANAELRALPWADLTDHAPAAWVNTLTVVKRLTPRPPGVLAPAVTPTEPGVWRLRVTAPSYGRFTFTGSAAFAVGIGATGRAGVIDVDVRIRSPRPQSPIAIGSAAWEVDVRGDASLVVRHEALVPMPRARPPLTVGPIVPGGLAALRPAGLLGLLGQLRGLSPAEIEIPLGGSALRLRPGPKMTVDPALALGNRQLGLGKAGVVVSVSGLAPSYSADRLSLKFLGARLALAGRRT